MPRHSGGANGFTDGNCKIRKRVCSSPSSTPSVLKSCRCKRAILARKSGGSTTPVPMWMMNDGSPSPAASSRDSHCQRPKAGHRGWRTSVSARKLANALWELNRFPSPKTMEELQERRSKKEMIRAGGKLSSLKQGSLSHLSDPSHSPASELTYRTRLSTRRKMLPLIYPSSGRSETNCISPDMLRNAGLTEMEGHLQSIAKRSSTIGTNGHLKALKRSLTTLKELLKLLNGFLGPGQQQPSIIALASALSAQIDQASVLVNNAIKEQRFKENEISYLRKQFAMETDSWRTKEQERRTTISHSIIKELETERKLRRRADRMNTRLGMELSQMKTLLLKAASELEKEKRTREVIEQVCTEIVRDVGQDKARVEELKKESVKAREELEKEREMLHLANELREERVHMKLSEAKFQFEEKNAAVDKLRYELEAFLAVKRTEMVNEEQDQLRATRTISCTNLAVDREEGQEGDDGIDSEDSELHSIELNTGSNDNGYSWSHATLAFENEDELVPYKKNNEPNSTLTGVRNNNCSFDESTAGAKDGFLKHSRCLSSELVERKFTDDIDQKLDQDAKRCSSVLDPGFQNSSRTKIVLPRSIPSPIRRWSKQQFLHRSNSQLCEGSKVNEMLKAIRESESKARLVTNRNEVRSQS